MSTLWRWLAFSIAVVWAAGASFTVAGDPAPKEPAGKAEPPPKAFTNNHGMKFVRIPPGEFIMGAEDGETDEKPAHRVKISRAFYLCVYEVTFGVVDKLEKMKDHVVQKKYRVYSREPNEPANLTFEGAVRLCQILTESDPKGIRYRLPTEAEWEYAARGGLKRKAYPWGEGIDPGKACYGGKRVRPVGSFPPNGFGLYDMAGNVWEWCSDWYDKAYYLRSPPEDPKGPSTGKYKVIRGGAFFDNEDLLRVTARDWISPSGDVGTCGAFGLAPYGVRVVAELPEKKAETKEASKEGEEEKKGE
ncbi:MAG: formylglycine-generating enzyme family protein [Planctomycetota bacterium]|jgi:formylglycine-generating enzyme required for sulfatase activity